MSIKEDVIEELEAMVEIGMRGAKVALEQVKEGFFDATINDSDHMGISDLTDLIVDLAPL